MTPLFLARIIYDRLSFQIVFFKNWRRKLPIPDAKHTVMTPFDEYIVSQSESEDAVIRLAAEERSERKRLFLDSHPPCMTDGVFAEKYPCVTDVGQVLLPELLP